MGFLFKYLVLISLIFLTYTIDLKLVPHFSIFNGRFKPKSFTRVECLSEKYVMMLKGLTVSEHSKNRKRRLLQLMKHLQGEFLSSASIFPRLTGGCLKKPKQQQSVEESNRNGSECQCLQSYYLKKITLAQQLLAEIKSIASELFKALTATISEFSVSDAWWGPRVQLGMPGRL